MTFNLPRHQGYGAEIDKALFNGLKPPVSSQDGAVCVEDQKTYGSPAT